MPDFLIFLLLEADLIIGKNDSFFGAEILPYFQGVCRLPIHIDGADIEPNFGSVKVVPALRAVGILWSKTFKNCKQVTICRIL